VGGDNAGNLYFCGDVVYDSAGRMKFAGISNVEGLGWANAFTSDVATGTLYFLENGPYQIEKYSSSGSHLATFPFLAGNDLAFSASRKLYQVKNTQVDILDPNTGARLNTVTDSRFINLQAIAIDSTDNKYLYDASSGTIHILDASDRYLRSLTLGGNASRVRMRIGPDGYLVVMAYGTAGNPADWSYVKKLRPDDGSQIWYRGYAGGPNQEPASDFAIDGAGRIFVLRSVNLEVLDSSGTLITSTPWIYSSMNTPRNPAPMTAIGNNVFIASDRNVYVITID
jgi:hypothetical protein